MTTLYMNQTVSGVGDEGTTIDVNDEVVAAELVAEGWASVADDYVPDDTPTPTSEPLPQPKDGAPRSAYLDWARSVGIEPAGKATPAQIVQIVHEALTPPEE